MSDLLLGPILFQVELYTFVNPSLTNKTEQVCVYAECTIRELVGRQVGTPGKEGPPGVVVLLRFLRCRSREAAALT